MSSVMGINHSCTPTLLKYDLFIIITIIIIHFNSDIKAHKSRKSLLILSLIKAHTRKR